MSSPVFTGNKINNKRKDELVAICNALEIPSEGSREHILKVVKAYLVDNKASLVNDPRFAGLYPTLTRRRGAKSAGDDDEEEEEAVATPEPASEEVFGVKTRTSPRRTRQSALQDLITRAEESEAVQALAHPGDAVVALRDSTAVVRRKSVAALRRLSLPQLPAVEQKTIQYRAVVRDFLSDDQVIASLTVAIECLWFVSTILPVTYYTFNVPAALNFKTPPPHTDTLTSPAPHPATIHLAVPTPTLDTFTAFFFWALPTFILPALAGALISFAKPKKNVDPLTAAIVRLAAVWAAGSAGGVPVEARIAGAAVSLAFAFANSIWEAKA